MGVLDRNRYNKIWQHITVKHFVQRSFRLACVAVGGAGGWGPLGGGLGTVGAGWDRWGRGAFRLLIKSSHFKMYCQQIFSFVQLPYRFAILNLYDETLTSL